MSAIHKETRRQYLKRLEREDIARNAEAKAYEQALELTQWRKLANAAMNAAERCGSNVDWLRLWQDELISVRSDEEWNELNERLGF